MELYGDNVLKNNYPTIGVLLASMTSNFHKEIMKGIDDTAKKLGYNVIGFSGGPFNSPNPLEQLRENVFDLVDVDLIQGLIIPVGSHTRFISKEETDAFINKYSKVPVINIGGYIDEYINVLSDNEGGFSELIRHMIEVHGAKKIGLVRGAGNHLVSDLRMEVYKSTLEEYDIELDESLIVYGDLNRNISKHAVEQLWNRRKEKCDAIVTVNDIQALGIIEELTKQGIKVPEDVAVTGFMGVSEGVCSEPPLTSVKEPMYEMGKEALLALAKIIDDEKVADKIIVPTEVLIRKSCGCQGRHQMSREEYFNCENSAKYKESENSNQMLKEQCLKIYEKSRLPYHEDIIDSLIDKFNVGLAQEDVSEFLQLLRMQFKRVLVTDDILIWMGITEIFRKQLFERLMENKESKKLSESFESLLYLKDEHESILYHYKNNETDFYNDLFRCIVNNLNASFELEDIKDVVLKILDLSELYISLYERESSRVVNRLAVHNKEIVNLKEEEKKFDGTLLIPKSIKRFKKRYSLIVLPLAFRRTPYGFMVMNLTDRKASAYENVQAIVGAALKSELQIQELIQAEERFSDIAHSTTDWLWEIDENYEFIYSSLNVKNVIGYKYKDVINKSIFDFSATESNSFKNHIEAHKGLVSIECWYLNKKGRIVYLLASAKPIIKDNKFKGYRGIFKDISAQKKQEEEIRQLAYFDILTGLPNRTMFQERLKSVFKKASRDNEVFALMFLDIDRFKYINDSIGHSAGDKLLVQVAKILSERVGDKDIVSRLGGDEFTVILPNVENEEQVIHVAQNIIDTMAENPIVINGKNFFVTISIGIAFYPEDGTDSVVLLKSADTAMYKAKERGKNQFVIYESRYEKKNELRIKFEDILYSAIRNDELVVHYQPQVYCITGKTSCLEGLVRIKSPIHGLISPNHFIALAEELGLINKIGEIVLEKVCKQHRKWKKEGYGKVYIAVNLSTHQLKNTHIVERYIEIIEMYNVEPKYIQLEITENALIENDAIALDILNRFKEYGITIALDDFGTGFSSLQCIQKFPIDVVKIDRSFIGDTTNNPKNIAIISTIKHLADSLDLTIVVEGVENKEQYDKIRALGCNQIQGYYFSKPLSCKKIGKVLDTKFYFNID